MTIEKRNLLLSSAGQLVSLFGSAIYTFALGLHVLEMTGSGFSFAMNLVMGLLPVILVNPFAGVIADRLDKKRTVIISDLSSGILLLGLYLMTIEGPLTLGLIYASTFLLTALTQVLGITFEAAKPNLVGREIPVVRLNSISQMVLGMTAILGPLVGGMVYALVEVRLFILVNGISFVLSALSECFIDFGFNRSSEPLPHGSAGVFREIREGYRYLKSREDLMEFMTLFVMGNFFISAAVSVGLPYLINVELSMPSAAYGVIQGVFPIGLILGAIFVERMTARIALRRLVFFSMLGVGMLIGLLGLAVSLPIPSPSGLVAYFIAIAIAFGMAITFIDVPTMTHTQTEVEDEFRGRVMSIRHSLVKIINPIAFMMSGLLVGKVGASPMMIGSSLLFILYLVGFKRDLASSGSSSKKDLASFVLRAPK